MKAQPFVRWLGGKRRLAARVLDILGTPEPYGRYFEPFLGGGAVFFALRERGYDGPALLSDVNADLVALYCVVRDQLDDLLDALDGCQRDKALYLGLRTVDPEQLSELDRAARAYYLNRCAVNGIWRVNKKGGYNVPYSAKKGPLVDEARLRAASTALQGAEIICGDGGELLERGIVAPLVEVSTGRAGDRVFLDPPYLKTFTGYTAGGWSVDNSWQLENCASACVDRGARVVVTLPDCEEEREVWGRRWQLLETQEARSVAADGKRRGQVPCMMAVGPAQDLVGHVRLVPTRPPRNEELAAAMAQAGINQTQLAAVTGVDQSQVNRWVAGTLCPTFEQLTKAKDVLGVEGDGVLGYRVEHKPVVRRT